MARGKKKESALTPEEKLAQALVPAEEEPYKVPDNWVWTHWGNCGEFIAGNGFKNEYQGFQGLPIPFYKVGSLKYSDSSGYLYDATNTIDEEIRGKLKATIIPVNSVVFAKIGEAIRLNRRSLNATPCCIDTYRLYVKDNMVSSAGQNTISRKGMAHLEVPIPCEVEQAEIVRILDSIFAKEQQAKEAAEAVLEKIDLLKKSILARAFRGELGTNDPTEESALELLKAIL